MENIDFQNLALLALSRANFGSKNTAENLSDLANIYTQLSLQCFLMIIQKWSLGNHYSQRYQIQSAAEKITHTFHVCRFFHTWRSNTGEGAARAPRRAHDLVTLISGAEAGTQRYSKVEGLPPPLYLVATVWTLQEPPFIVIILKNTGLNSYFK